FFSPHPSASHRTPPGTIALGCKIASATHCPPAVRDSHAMAPNSSSWHAPCHSARIREDAPMAEFMTLDVMACRDGEPDPVIPDLTPYAPIEQRLKAIILPELLKQETALTMALGATGFQDIQLSIYPVEQTAGLIQVGRRDPEADPDDSPRLLGLCLL